MMRSLFRLGFAMILPAGAGSAWAKDKKILFSAAPPGVQATIKKTTDAGATLEKVEVEVEDEGGESRTTCTLCRTKCRRSRPATRPRQVRGTAALCAGQNEAVATGCPTHRAAKLANAAGEPAANECCRRRARLATAPSGHGAKCFVETMRKR